MMRSKNPIHESTALCKQLFKKGGMVCEIIVTTIQASVCIGLGVVAGGTVGLIVNRGFQLTDGLLLVVTAVVTWLSMKLFAKKEKKWNYFSRD